MKSLLFVLLAGLCQSAFSVYIEQGKIELDSSSDTAYIGERTLDNLLGSRIKDVERTEQFGVINLPFGNREGQGAFEREARSDDSSVLIYCTSERDDEITIYGTRVYNYYRHIAELNINGVKMFRRVNGSLENSFSIEDPSMEFSALESGIVLKPAVEDRSIRFNCVSGK